MYQQSYALTLEIHRLTRSFPADERFALVDQLRRASRSIPVNLAEGWGVHTERNFGHYVSQALGSANEMQVHLDLAKDLGYMTADQYAALWQRYETLGKRLFKLRENAKF